MRFPYGSAIFYHFHGLRIITERKVQIGNYLLPKALRVNVYKPYFSDLRKALNLLSKHDILFIPQAKQLSLVRRYYLRIRRLASHFMPLFAPSERRL